MSDEKKSSLACSNAVCEDPSHPHPPRPAVERQMVKIEMGVAVNVDIGPNRPTEAEVIASIDSQLPIVRETLIEEYRRLLAGGAPTEPRVPRLVAEDRTDA